MICMGGNLAYLYLIIISSILERNIRCIGAHYRLICDESKMMIGTILYKLRNNFYTINIDRCPRIFGGMPERCVLRDLSNLVLIPQNSLKSRGSGYFESN